MVWWTWWNEVGAPERGSGQDAQQRNQDNKSEENQYPILLANIFTNKAEAWRVIRLVGRMVQNIPVYKR